MRRIGIVPIALAITVLVGCDRNDRPATSANGSPAVGTSGNADKVKGADRDFVKDLTIGNMAEIELGKLATEKSADAEVKKFARMVIDDHTEAANKLKAIATKHSIPVPTELEAKQRDLREDLSKKQGPDFDRAYMDAMVDKHEDTLDKLGSRVDKQKLAEWRTRAEERVSGRKVEERTEANTITPEPSDDLVTMAINQWAANAYPIVYAHHASAKRLSDTLKNKRTN